MVQQVEFNMFHKFHCVCISTAVAASDDNIWLFGLLVTALFTSMKLPYLEPVSTGMVDHSQVYHLGD